MTPLVVEEIFATNDDGRSAKLILVDGEEYARLVDGEPEDNSLCRNFNFDLHDLVYSVALAAMNGRICRHEFKEVSWDEFWEM